MKWISCFFLITASLRLDTTCAFYMSPLPTESKQSMQRNISPQEAYISDNVSGFMHPLWRHSGLLSRRPRLCRSAGEVKVQLSMTSNDAMFSSKPAFDAAVLYRHACKKFQRFDESDRSTGASLSDPSVVKQAVQALELARLSPSSYNSQPYKFVVVHSKQQKEALAKYALGPNQNRVLDSDVTVVFLADRQVLRTLPAFRQHLSATDKWARRKMQLYLGIFSSGYPLPRFINSIFSFIVRTSFSFVDLITRRFYPMPTLSSAETWSSKQALMVAMTYMLACASRGLDTIPMEGIHAGGIRQALGVPSRYAVPIIVSTGREFHAKNSMDAGKAVRIRYPMEEMIYGNRFGQSLEKKVLPDSTG